ncbi:MAG: hypothetical protein N2578_03345 [Bdellovibrionaceae bacterium]|nr:hypothetical protein [Pseudobdellovibrionaceae bacterium]
MSNKLSPATSKSLLLSLVAIGLIAISAITSSWLLQKYHKGSASREPASFEIYQGKAHALITARIATPPELPEDENAVVKLRGRVLSSTQLHDVHYEWELPDEVHIVEGNSWGRIETLEPGVPVDFEIAVVGFSSEINRRISLITQVVHQGTNHGNSATVTSRPQDTLEFYAREMAENEALSRGEKIPQGGLRKKILR